MIRKTICIALICMIICGFVACASNRPHLQNAENALNDLLHQALRNVPRHTRISVTAFEGLESHDSDYLVSIVEDILTRQRYQLVAQEFENDLILTGRYEALGNKRRIRLEVVDAKTAEKKTYSANL